MFVEPESMDLDSEHMEFHDEFERELQQVLARRPAPPGFKRRLMERRPVSSPRWPLVTWQRLAASLVLTAFLAGGAAWRSREERRKEEAARDQVLTALRIATRALNQMNATLAAHGRNAAQD
jgi:hypothetical protein